MKKIRVETLTIVRVEEHGSLVSYGAGRRLVLPRRYALELEAAGQVVLLDDVPQEEKVALQRRPHVSGPPGSLVFRGTSELLNRARAFWYNNEPTLSVGGFHVSREAMWTYGGPSPQFNRCATCQQAEWLSRLFQRNMFQSHAGCPNVGECQALCAKQGDDRFTQVHQNHWFLSPCDPNLNAPRCAVVLFDRWYDAFYQPGGSHVTINKRRAFAQAFQADMYRFSQWGEIDWGKYDLLYLENTRNVPLLPRPDIPILMYGHDHWKGNPQEALDHYQPDILITPFPYLWQSNMRLPAHTHVRLYAAGASTFFTRPNTDPARKTLDLLCIGAMSKGPDGPYGPRIIFHEQVLKLPERYAVGHMHTAQFGYAAPDTPLTEAYTMLNTYSEALGRARYVAFAPCQGMAAGGLWIKYYEILGSGAVPIMPQVHDLDMLGIQPGVHYIPYAEIGSADDSGCDPNQKLIWYLDRYEEHRHVAVSAAAWHAEHADDLLFGGFERAVRELTGERYPARMLETPASVLAEQAGAQAAFFTIPREWVEPFKTRQDNAIGSWRQLSPPPHLILFCDDPGVADAAARWGAMHVADGARNVQGTPRIDDVFLRGQQLAQDAGAEVAVYCNTDVILGTEFERAVRIVMERFDSFLIVGARWDVDLTTPIDYDDPKWREELLAYVKGKGKRHSQGALDYFAFRPGLYKEVPAFAVGRSAWDNWLVCEANYLGAHTVDAGAFVMAVHQNIPGKKAPPTAEQVEKAQNWELYAARRCPHQSGSANNCRWILKADGSLEERPSKQWRP